MDASERTEEVVLYLASPVVYNGLLCRFCCYRQDNRLVNALFCKDFSKICHCSVGKRFVTAVSGIFSKCGNRTLCYLVCKCMGVKIYVHKKIIPLSKHKKSQPQGQRNSQRKRLLLFRNPAISFTS